MTARLSVTLKINGEERTAAVRPFDTLLTTLREDLALQGSKRGCNQGVCGACTVLIDGRPVRSCLSLTANCVDAEVTTIEGLAPGGRLSAIQKAFAETGAVQCGFCTSGMLLAAHVCLQSNAKPTADDVKRALSGNLCRCSGYKKIVDAVLLAAEGGT